MQEFAFALIWVMHITNPHGVSYDVDMPAGTGETYCMERLVSMEQAMDEVSEAQGLRRGWGYCRQETRIVPSG